MKKILVVILLGLLSVGLNILGFFAEGYKKFTGYNMPLALIFLSVVSIIVFLVLLLGHNSQDIYRKNWLAWIFMLIISLQVSMYCFWESTTFGEFFYGSLTGAMILFGTATLFAHIIHSEKRILFGILFFVGIVVSVLFLIVFLLPPARMMVQPLSTPAHYRTHIITGQCDFGGGSTNLVRDPWYYRDGCSDEKKLELQREECSELCRTGNKGMFCVREFPDNGMCKDLVQCDIICP